MDVSIYVSNGSLIPDNYHLILFYFFKYNKTKPIHFNFDLDMYVSVSLSFTTCHNNSSLPVFDIRMYVRTYLWKECQMNIFFLEILNCENGNMDIILPRVFISTLLPSTINRRSKNAPQFKIV